MSESPRVWSVVASRVPWNAKSYVAQTGVVLLLVFGVYYFRIDFGEAGVKVASFVAFIVAAIVWVKASNLVEVRRSASLREAAARLRLGYANGADEDLLSALSTAGILPGRKLGNVSTGQAASQNLAVFDHRYSYGSGKHHRTVNQTVACFRFPEPWVPGFSLRPQTFSDNLYLWAKPVDFDFDSHPKSSREYLLDGESEAAVRKLFTRPLLDHLEGIAGLSVAGRDALLVVYRPGKRVRPDDLTGFLQEASGVAAAFVKAAR